MIRSMRGITSKRRHKNAIQGIDTIAVKAISTSHRAMGSINQAFADMIAAISQFSPAFDPANTDLTLASLKDKYAQILNANAKTTTGNAAWIKAKTVKNEKYSELKDRIRRIIASIRSQYGYNSSEYSLIKSLNI